MAEEKDNQGVEPEPEVTDTEDIEVLREALTEAKTQAESHLDSWKRSQADFVNYKRRSEQERDEARQFANAVLICNLLPVLDDLERALSSVPKELAKLPWVEGIKLIEHKFNSILESQGVTLIKAKGKPFDPNLHEAAMCSQGKEGIVIKEMEKGYMLRDRVIRPAMVSVGNGATAKEPGKHK